MPDVQELISRLGKECSVERSEEGWHNTTHFCSCQDKEFVVREPKNQDSDLRNEHRTLQFLQDKDFAPNTIAFENGLHAMEKVGDRELGVDEMTENQLRKWGTMIADIHSEEFSEYRNSYPEAEMLSLENWWQQKAGGWIEEIDGTPPEATRRVHERCRHALWTRVRQDGAHTRRYHLKHQDIRDRRAVHNRLGVREVHPETRDVDGIATSARKTERRRVHTRNTGLRQQIRPGRTGTPEIHRGWRKDALGVRRHLAGEKVRSRRLENRKVPRRRFLNHPAQHCCARMDLTPLSSVHVLASFDRVKYFQEIPSTQSPKTDLG
nr:MAG: hypothetical protein J07AB56_01480 [Candidatus Nanosalinarum sp. J07AB56]